MEGGPARRAVRHRAPHRGGRAGEMGAREGLPGIRRRGQAARRLRDHPGHHRAQAGGGRDPGALPVPGAESQSRAPHRTRRRDSICQLSQRRPVPRLGGSLRRIGSLGLDSASRVRARLREGGGDGSGLLGPRLLVRPGPDRRSRLCEPVRQGHHAIEAIGAGPPAAQCGTGRARGRTDRRGAGERGPLSLVRDRLDAGHLDHRCSGPGGRRHALVAGLHRAEPRRNPRLELARRPAPGRPPAHGRDLVAGRGRALAVRRRVPRATARRPVSLAVGRGVPVLAGTTVREWVGACTDVTEQKRAEEEMCGCEEELATWTEWPGWASWQPLWPTN